MHQTEQEIVTRLREWGQAHDDVRAMILTSSRTSPTAPVDILSDYDVVVYTDKVPSYYDSRDWLDHFGRVLVLYRDPLSDYMGHPCCAFITQYEDGLKIDFTITSPAVLPLIAGASERDEGLDVGYRVLLDKDDLTRDLPPPTYQAHIPARPTEAEYLTRVELFLHEATYVAKHLWRGDLMAAKFNFDQAMKQDELRIMLEWQIEHEHGWSLKPGAYGRSLQRYLRHDLWAALEQTYVGSDLDENWGAMFRTIALYRRVATEVGDQLGYAYPDDLHRRAVDYLKRIRQLPRQKPAFRGDARQKDAT